MVRLKTMAFGALTLALGMAGSSPALAKAVSGPSTLVIGVDHTDPANQDQAAHRWFEYTDFFSRDVRVHSGEVLDFRFAPGELGHTVGLGPNAETPRLVYPLASVDTGDVPATGSGAPKLVLGAGNFAITNGSTSGGGTIGQDPTGGDRPCGVAPLPVCHFRGGNDIEDSGPIFGTDAQDNPVTVDWKISVDAAPGDYAFLCWFHAGMQGTLHVVDASAPPPVRPKTTSAATFSLSPTAPMPQPPRLPTTSRGSAADFPAGGPTTSRSALVQPTCTPTCSRCCRSTWTWSTATR